MKYNKEQIAIKQLKIKSIHKDIIRLKQENRNIGDKVRSFDNQVKTNCLKPNSSVTSDYTYSDRVKREGENFDDSRLRNCLKQNSSVTSDYTYSDRIKRDLTTIEYLQKL